MLGVNYSVRVDGTELKSSRGIEFNGVINQCKIMPRDKFMVLTEEEKLEGKSYKTNRWVELDTTTNKTQEMKWKEIDPIINEAKNIPLDISDENTELPIAHPCMTFESDKTIEMTLNDNNTVLGTITITIPFVGIKYNCTFDEPLQNEILKKNMKNRILKFIAAQNLIRVYKQLNIVSQVCNKESNEEEEKKNKRQDIQQIFKLKQ